MNNAVQKGCYSKRDSQDFNEGCQNGFIPWIGSNQGTVCLCKGNRCNSASGEILYFTHYAELNNKLFFQVSEHL